MLEPEQLWWVQEAVGRRCGCWDKSTDSQGIRDARVRGYL